MLSNVVSDISPPPSNGITQSQADIRYEQKSNLNSDVLGITNPLYPKLIASGTAQLSSGFVTINTVYADLTTILLSYTFDSFLIPGILTVENVVLGTSFDVRSVGSTNDNSNISWVIYV